MRSQDTIRQGALTYNVVDVFGSTPALPLVRAAVRGDTSEVKRLVATGVNPNTVGQHDITPLWWAAWAENLDGFKALLEAGANPNFQRHEGFSLMILVTRMNDPRFLELALKHGGDPNFRDAKPSKTPIFEAVMSSDAGRQRQLLLQAGADLNAQDGAGWTPMMMAIATRGDYQLVWDFLQRGRIIVSRRTTRKRSRTLSPLVG